MPKKNQKQKRIRKLKQPEESDSTFFLKLVLYVVLGTMWIKLSEPLEFGGLIIFGFPVGLLIGIFFASHDHFQVNRKIGYTILVIMTIVSYFAPAGIIL